MRVQKASLSSPSVSRSSRTNTLCDGFPLTACTPSADGMTTRATKAAASRNARCSISATRLAGRAWHALTNVLFEFTRAKTGQARRKAPIIQRVTFEDAARLLSSLQDQHYAGHR
jgi:hypothetical protein